MMSIKLEFSDQHFQIIAEALGNMPLRVALPVVQEINRQVAELTKIQTERNEDGQTS